MAEVIDNTTSRGRTLRFLYDGDHDDFKQQLYALGEAPLPSHIIKRKAEPQDLEDFQCIYARHEGAVTAPAAGLHFSRSMLKRLEIKGVRQAFLTLHCGLGNFRQTDVEDLTKHKMDSEEMRVTSECCAIVNEAKRKEKRVCAVGTTVQRALETCVSTGGEIKEFEGWTNKFIFPPYPFSVATDMLTNFHLPESTMLMSAAAFGGYEATMKAYKEAIKQGYKFGPYGDAMLIVD